MRIRERTAYVQERLSLLDRTPIAWRFMARAQRAAFRTLDWPYRNHRVCHCLSTTAPRCAQPAIRRVLPVLLLMLTMLLPASKPAHTEQNPRKFGVYYGERFDPQLSAFDVLVLDADSGLDLGGSVSGRKRGSSSSATWPFAKSIPVEVLLGRHDRLDCCCTNLVIGREASISTFDGLNGSGWSSTKSRLPS